MRSNPSPRTNLTTPWALRFGQRLGAGGHTYLTRWFLETPFGSMRLHRWTGSDDLRALHDHGWNFVTFVLKGRYFDVTEQGEEELRAGSVRVRRAEHAHCVRIGQGETCWTLLFTGPRCRVWGFYPKGKWINAKRYFFKHGHHTPEGAVRTQKLREGLSCTTSS